MIAFADAFTSWLQFLNVQVSVLQDSKMQVTIIVLLSDKRNNMNFEARSYPISCSSRGSCQAQVVRFKSICNWSAFIDSPMHCIWWATIVNLLRQEIVRSLDHWAIWSGSLCWSRRDEVKLTYWLIMMMAMSCSKDLIIKEVRIFLVTQMLLGWIFFPVTDKLCWSDLDELLSILYRNNSVNIQCTTRHEQESNKMQAYSVCTKKASHDC